MSWPGGNSRSTGPFAPSFNAWNLAVAAAGLIATVVAAFLFPPPFDLGANDMLPKFGKFVFTVLIAVLLVPLLNYSSRRFMVRWMVSSIVILVVCIVVFSWYLSLGAHYVREHRLAGGAVVRYVIAASFSPTGAMLYDKLRGLSAVPPSTEDLIKHASGASFEERRYSIWDRDAVASVQLMLGAVYVALFVLFGALVILAGQTMRSTMSKT